VTITLLYFAAVRELVGKDEESLDLPEGVSTIAELATFLARRDAALGVRLPSVRFARNESFAAKDERLEPGDIVALIPPVAGG
jgi:molybdopterin converting factor subunit 1